MSTDPAAELKAWLAGLGQPVDPKGKVTIAPAAPAGAVIVLDRVRQDVTPPYCIHGYSECFRCHQPVWLGHETERVVASGEAMPICLDCARTDIPVKSVDTKLITRVHDHLRKDGPHT